MSEELEIRTAKDLFVALQSPDEGLRVAVLEAMAENPELATRFGAYQGRDVVDLLVGQSREKVGITYWLYLARALAIFSDPRVTEFFAEAILRRENAEAVQLAEWRLRQEPLDRRPLLLRPLLFVNGDPGKVAVAARILDGHPGLDDRERVRASLAIGQDAGLVPSVEEPLGPWIQELEGPYAIEAQARFARTEPGMVAKLAERWPDMGFRARRWFVGYASATDPLRAVPVLEQALADSPEVMRTALLAIASSEALESLFRPITSRLAEHADAAIRAGAIAAGADGPRDRWFADPDERVVIAAIDRSNAPEALATLLAHASWQVRAKAVDRLVKIGSGSVPHLRPLASSHRVEVRSAATNALLQLGEAEFLEESLQL